MLCFRDCRAEFSANLDSNEAIHKLDSPGYKTTRGEEQIVGVLKEAEAEVPVKELCRRIGISDATFYYWKAKYGGLEVNEARSLIYKPGDLIGASNYVSYRAWVEPICFFPPI